MKTAFLILSIAGFGAPAFANCPAGPSVDMLSCTQAQDFAAANGCYWVNHDDGNGALPIYPVYSADHSCDVNERANPMIEQTADSAGCAVGYQCISNLH